MPETDRILGEHGARLDAIDKSLEKISSNVEILVADKNQAEGSKRAFYTVAAIIGSVSGAVATAAMKFLGK